MIQTTAANQPTLNDGAAVLGECPVAGTVEGFHDWRIEAMTNTRADLRCSRCHARRTDHRKPMFET